METKHALGRPHRVIKLLYLVRCSEFSMVRGVARSLEGCPGNFMNSQVVGMRILVLSIGIANQHLGTLATNGSHEARDRLIKRCVGKSIRSRIGLRIGHPRISIAEPDQAVITDDLAGRLKFASAALAQALTLSQFDRWIEDVPLFSSSAAHQHCSHSLAAIAGNRARAF